jgi:hypothetical protein
MSHFIDFRQKQPIEWPVRLNRLRTTRLDESDH